jgi:hypothetical protein
MGHNLYCKLDSLEVGIGLKVQCQWQVNTNFLIYSLSSSDPDDRVSTFARLCRFVCGTIATSKLLASAPMTLLSLY